MAHLLARLGAAALRPRPGRGGGGALPPLIPREEAMRLREQFYASGEQWPYEDIVPGPPQEPHNAAAYLARAASKERMRAARNAEIKAAMARMPAMVAEYRAARKLDWSEVSPLDKLTMTQAQIKEKYIKRKLARLG
eukprot:364909-Chlamydomonas_euryale.AAC.5